MSNTKPSTRYGLFLPLLLGLASLAIWFGFQTVQLMKEEKNLSSLGANQEALYETAQKMRTQLDVIADGVSKLAENGNTQAASVVEALRARGITINPNASVAPEG